jgi:hypothetical protein
MLQHFSNKMLNQQFSFKVEIIFLKELHKHFVDKKCWIQHFLKRFHQQFHEIFFENVSTFSEKSFNIFSISSSSSGGTLLLHLQRQRAGRWSPLAAATREGWRGRPTAAVRAELRPRPQAARGVGGPATAVKGAGGAPAPRTWWCKGAAVRVHEAGEGEEVRLGFLRSDGCDWLYESQTLEIPTYSSLAN